MPKPVPVLVVTGTVGVGKTTVAYEIGELLSERAMGNAVVDLDALAAQWPASSRWNADLMFENLSLLWPNFRAHGAERLVLAHVLEDEADKERFKNAVPDADITIVRVVAPTSLREDRLRRRMPPGRGLDWHLKRTVELEAILSLAAQENFSVDNGERPIRAVAEEILTRIAWL